MAQFFSATLATRVVLLHIAPECPLLAIENGAFDLIGAIAKYVLIADGHQRRGEYPCSSECDGCRFVLADIPFSERDQFGVEPVSYRRAVVAAVLGKEGDRASCRIDHLLRLPGFKPWIVFRAFDSKKSIGTIKDRRSAPKR